MSDVVSAQGTVHGRFQPFHLGHLHYCRLALARCRELVVGITNPDLEATAGESPEAHRHTPSGNPFSYLERYRMVRDSLLAEGLAPERLTIVPFDINHLESRPPFAYMPRQADWFIRVKGDWGAQKRARLGALGLRVVELPMDVLAERTATDVRAALAAGRGWAELVPAACAAVLTRIDAPARLARLLTDAPPGRG